MSEERPGGAPAVDLERIGACPACRGRLAFSKGAYACQGCGALWPIVKGIPRFVDSEHYVGSFGWEWRRHKRTQIDDASSKESEATFAAKTGLTPADVRGKLVLDVGVGSGRFSHVVARWGGIPVGVDLSLAVLSARRNLRAFYPNALVLQGDAFRLPFQEETFDIVFSIGVLHHTPSTRDAFRQVARFAKPGGTVAIALYDAVGAPFFVHATRYRRATTEEPPHPLLHFLSHAAIPNHHALDAAKTLLGRSTRDGLHRALATVEHADPLWRVLDTFDWYSPHYQWLHDEPEVKRWFEELGFDEVRRMPERTMVSVRGRRPAKLLAPPPSEEGRLGALAPLPPWIPEGPGAPRTAALLALLALEIGRATAIEVATAASFQARRAITAVVVATKRAITAVVVGTKNLLGIEGDLLSRPKEPPAPDTARRP